MVFYPLSRLFILKCLYILLVYTFTHLTFFQRHFMAHDALWKMPSTLRNSTVLRATAAALECLQLHRQVVPTHCWTSEHRLARLCMAACRTMARQSGYSKYEQEIQRLTHNLWVEVVSMVHTLPEVRSRQTASDARMLCENPKYCNMAAQDTYGKVMSPHGIGTCLSAVKWTVLCNIWYSISVVF
jgi:hypothetical protein